MYTKAEAIRIESNGKPNMEVKWRRNRIGMGNQLYVERGE